MPPSPSHAYVVDVARLLPETFECTTLLTTNDDVRNHVTEPLICSLSSRFRITQVLGSGSQAFVYLAIERSTRRQVAVKISVVSPQCSHVITGHTAHLLCNSFFVTRVLHTATLVSQGVTLVVVVTDYCDLGDLRHILKSFIIQKKWWCEVDVGRMLAQMGIAINRLHRQNIIHRDIKTANVFSNVKGIVRLGDFGFAKQYSTSVHKNVDQGFLGSPYYMAPEFFRQQPYSCKVDMWSLGVVAYELLSRQRPFPGCPGDAKTLFTAMKTQILTGSFQDLRVYRPQVSTEIANIIVWLLKIDPRKRLSIAEFLTTGYMRQALNNLRSYVMELTTFELGLSDDSERSSMIDEIDRTRHAARKHRDLEYARQSAALLAGCNNNGPSTTSSSTLCVYMRKALTNLPVFI